MEDRRTLLALQVLRTREFRFYFSRLQTSVTGMSKTFAGCFQAVKLGMFAEINAYYRAVESAIILVAITHRS